MSFLDALIEKFPGVREPKTHLNFKSRLKWTGIILILFLVLGQITIYGVSSTAKEQFAFFELVLGSSIGSLMTLGIGPIVTASIILQLLVGSGILGWNIRTTEGRKKFQGTQKLLTIIFAIFESFAFVAFGALQPASPDAGLLLLVTAQLAFGAILVLFMDEVISKWGIGSGVSLFIAAGVSRQIFIRALNPLTLPGETLPAGLLPQFVSFLSLGELFQAFIALLPIIATIVVFAIVVFVQSMKVEIPLAFGSIRGFSRRWPLNLVYTSNIPVILIAALLANLQLVGNIGARVTESGLRCGFLGCFDTTGNPVSGIVQFFIPPSTLPVQIFFLTILIVVFVAALLSFYMRFGNTMRVILFSIIVGALLGIAISHATVGIMTGMETLRAIMYLLIFLIGSTIFSVFWVATSGMDAKSVAEQIEGLGMQIPGFRRDPRIVEEVLNRYIPTLAIISGIFIGVLAAVADFTSAIGSGTGILLTVMIIYNLYENIAQRYAEDMHPALRKFFQ